MIKQFFMIGVIFCLIPLTYSQTIKSTNSGAFTTNNLIYSIGDIFVNPVDSNEGSSGIVGIISKTELNSLGIEEIFSTEKVIFFPNPTSNFIFLETNKSIIKKVDVYDINGKLISTNKVLNKTIDLINLPIGTYLIKPENSNIKSFKIIKN